MVCTDLDVPKILPVDVLELCICAKYEACMTQDLFVRGLLILEFFSWG